MPLVALGLILIDRSLLWWVAGTLPARAMVAYAVTRTVAMPQIADDIGNWAQPLRPVVLTAEGLLIVITLGRHASPRSAVWLTQRLILWAEMCSRPA